jgi:hypothetical protein
MDINTAQRLLVEEAPPQRNPCCRARWCFPKNAGRILGGMQLAGVCDQPAEAAGYHKNTQPNSFQA